MKITVAKWSNIMVWACHIGWSQWPLLSMGNVLLRSGFNWPEDRKCSSPSRRICGVHAPCAESVSLRASLCSVSLDMVNNLSLRSRVIYSVNNEAHPVLDVWANGLLMVSGCAGDPARDACPLGWHSEDGFVSSACGVSL